uniref:Uncharacterized protein n=1 Tax=Fundidesulfovibrio putealis TaxID=270496 RepID=A0A7C4EJC4_9BACT
MHHARLFRARLTFAVIGLLVPLLLAAWPATSSGKAASRAATKAAPAVQEAQPPAQDPNAQGLLEFFKNENAPSAKHLDFQITAGFADIRTETPESSGRYFMAGQQIVGVAPDIYRLDLTFKHKYQRDIIDLAPEYFFTQQRSYYFWYNGGNKIVFKLGGARKEFKIDKKELTQIRVKSPETYTMEKTKLGMNMSFSEGGTTVHLEIKFI